MRIARTSRRCLLASAVVALAWVAAPAPVGATDRPLIVAAGIDATDRFVASWQLAPGTTFDFLEFSSVAIASPFVRGAFAGRNVVATICAAPAQGCLAPPTLTAYRAPEQVSRDRRYFVKVNARKGRRGALSSATWIIDSHKPTLPGGGRPAATATNQPAVGVPYQAPARRTIPPPRFVVESAPRRIARIIRDGVRVRVSCPAFACYAIVALKLGRTTLVFSDVTARPYAHERFVLRPLPTRRGALQRRRRARIEVLADVSYPGGKRTVISRRFTARR